MKIFFLFISIFLSASLNSQSVIKAHPNHKAFVSGGGCGTDLNVSYLAGTNYASTGTIWHSIDGVADPCMRTQGYIPSGEAGYYYADIAKTSGGLDSTKEAALMFTFSDVAACPPSDGWGTHIRYALFPNGGSDFYRVYEGGSVDDFSVLLIHYEAGDQYGLFRSAGGTVTAQYYRGGVWTVMHTFTQTSTADLYLAGSALSFSMIINPKVSCNFSGL